MHTKIASFVGGCYGFCKKITANLLTRVGFYIPTDLLHSGYMGSITYGMKKSR